MKVDLPAATMTAAILVLASSVLVGTKAMSATSTAPPAAAGHVPQAGMTLTKSFKIQCQAVFEQEIDITNVGDAPVPAGTVMKWQAPKRTFQFDANVVTFDAHSGTYTFQQPLDPKGQIKLNPNPTPAPGTTAGDPGAIVDIVGGLAALAGIRPCTFTISPAGPILVKPSVITPNH